MKTFLLIPVLAVSQLLAGCVVAPYPHRTVYVDHGYYGYYHRPYRRDVVVYDSGPYYRRSYYAPQTEVRYYNDYRGRYYYRGGRRIYVNAGVYY